MRISVFVTTLTILVGFVVGKPANAELLIHYNFEKDTLEDASGSKNVGEIRGDAERVKGSVGMGLKLDGVDDYVYLSAWETGGPLMFTHDAFTERSVAMWIKADDVNGEYTIFDEGGWSKGLAIVTEAGELKFSVRHNESEAVAAVKYTDTNWHHIAAFFNAGELHLYVDGEEAATGNAPYQQVGAHADGGAIGANQGADAFGRIMKDDNGQNVDEPGFFFKGIVDEFYYYDNAITDEEIEELYNQRVAVISLDKLTTTWGWIKAD